MKLHELQPAKGATKNRKRVGRGPGSGTGKTAGRGNKGQKSRSGYSRRDGFEGGQMPLIRRIPKRGFTNIFKEIYSIINVSDLNSFDAGTVVDLQLLVQAGKLAKRTNKLKVLGDGVLDVALTVKADRFSKSAEEKIVGKGGKVEVTKSA